MRIDNNANRLIRKDKALKLNFKPLLKECEYKINPKQVLLIEAPVDKDFGDIFTKKKKFRKYETNKSLFC